MLSKFLDDIAVNIDEKELKLKYVGISYKDIPESNFLYNIKAHIKKGIVLKVKLDKTVVDYIKKTSLKLDISIRETLEILDLIEEFHNEDILITDNVLMTLKYILETKFKKEFDIKILRQYLYTTFALKNDVVF